MAYTPTLTPISTFDPVPRVEVLFRDVDPATRYIDVYRLADGRQMPVRGGIRKSALGGASVLDHEAPNGVPATYRAEMFADQAGVTSLGFTDSAVVQLDFEGSCIQQPLDPSKSVRVGVLAGTADDLVRKSPGEMVYPEGGDVGTWVGGARQALTGVPVKVLTDTFEAADAFHSTLGGYGDSQVAVLCVRTPPPIRLPRVFFGTVAELHEVSRNVQAGGQLIEFDFTSDEVRAPAPGLVASLLSRDDIDAAYLTRNMRASAYLTRLDRDRDYSLAGYAAEHGNDQGNTVEDPEGSSLYLATNLTENPAGSGLYDTGTSVEDPAGSGLYIP